MREQQKKHLKLLWIFLGITFLLIGAAVGIFFIPVNFDIKLMIEIPVLIGLFIVTVRFNNKLQVSSLFIRYYRLLDSSSKKPFKLNYDIGSPIFESKLEKMGFKNRTTDSHLQSFYRLENAGKRKYFLHIIIIIRDNDIKLNSIEIDNEISMVENLFLSKEYRFKGYYTFQFKTVSSFNNETLDLFNQIIATKKGRTAFVNINIAHSKTQKKAYFLYSDTFSPTKEYKKGVEIVKEILGK